MRSSGIAIVVVLLAACPKMGGEYQQGGRAAGEADRGETNGRMFDFVSNKPDGDDWQIRIRGSSIWASYSKTMSLGVEEEEEEEEEEEKPKKKRGGDEGTQEFPAKNLNEKETKKVWKLIDRLELPERKRGKKDADEGYVSLRLREPGGEDGHEIFQTYVTRATEDEDVVELASYLADLIERHYKERPNF